MNDLVEAAIKEAIIFFIHSACVIAAYKTGQIFFQARASNKSINEIKKAEVSTSIICFVISVMLAASIYFSRGQNNDGLLGGFTTLFVSGIPSILGVILKANNEKEKLESSH